MRIREAVILLAVTLGSFGLAPAASAANVDYTLSCLDPYTVCQLFYDNGTITFSLPQFPVPDSTSPSRFFTINSVPANIEGESVTLTQMKFWAAPYSPGPGLGFNAPPDDLGDGNFYFTGPQLYQGSLGAPLLIPGDFRLFGLLGGELRGHMELQATLEQSSPGPMPDVPEPATWAMMITALGMLAIGRQLAVRARAKFSFMRQPHWRSRASTQPTRSCYTVM